MSTNGRYMQDTPELQTERTAEAWDRVFGEWSETINNGPGFLSTEMRRCLGATSAEVDINLLWRDAAALAVAWDLATKSRSRVIDDPISTQVLRLAGRQVRRQPAADRGALGHHGHPLRRIARAILSAHDITEIELTEALYDLAGGVPCDSST